MNRTMYLNPNTMSCHYCSKYGHKRNDCPERKNKTIKCYECGTFGHYKNDCPIIRERARIQREQEYAENNRINKQRLDAKRQTATDFVMKYYPEDLTKVLSNVDDIRAFLKGTRTTMMTVYLNSADEELNKPVRIQLYEEKILSHGDAPLSQFLHHLSFDDFLLFISHRPVFSKLSYKGSDNSLKYMIYDMAEHSKTTIKTVETEFNRQNDYYIKDKKVMRSRRHSIDWKGRVEELHTALICSTYDEYKNDGLISTGGSVDFIYADIQQRTEMMADNHNVEIGTTFLLAPTEPSSTCSIQ